MKRCTSCPFSCPFTGHQNPLLSVPHEHCHPGHCPWDLLIPFPLGVPGELSVQGCHWRCPSGLQPGKEVCKGCAVTLSDGASRPGTKSLSGCVTGLGHLLCATRVLCLNGSAASRSQGAGGCGFCSQAAAGALSFCRAVFLPSLPFLLCWKHIPKSDGQQQPMFWDGAPAFKVPVAVPRLVQLHAGQVHTLRSRNKPTLITRAGGTRRFQRPNAPHGAPRSGGSGPRTCRGRGLRFLLPRSLDAPGQLR